MCLNKFKKKIAKHIEISEEKIPPQILKDCKGIIFLTVIKAGFLISANFGAGIAMVKLNDGKWSGACSIGMSSLAGGLMAGKYMFVCYRHFLSYHSINIFCLKWVIFDFLLCLH